MAKAQLRTYVFTPGAAGAGTIEVPGKYDLQQFLVITNTTKNSIIYNFADTTYAGTTVTFSRTNDAAFVNALDNSDGTTTITLAINTSTMSSTDTLQILYEQPFQYVRSPEIGTDAFERQRVAAPQSLLDADFEYGMQPTKWLTISQERGYPSIYEVPGTDLACTAATTDASTLSGGASTAASIITITTAIAHGYQVGNAITIKGFNSAITGFDRAEGSFIIYQVPSPTTFTYIAKGKVGFNNGDNIYTPFIQLRQGGLYTGSSINAVINQTITATTTSTNLVTVGSTTGMFQGSPFLVQQVITNAVATNSSNNQITLGTTIGLIVGMPITMTGASFAGLTSGTTYYVKTIVDTRTITMTTDSGGTTVFVPSSTSQGGNMYVTGGASFGGLTAGTQYYIASVSSGTQVTLSNNINYTTSITNTYAVNNSVRFSAYTYQGISFPGTTNMTLGEQITITGTTIGNLVAGTYYVYQIIDGYTAILSTSATGYQTGSFFVQTTASGTMSAAVGTTIPLSTATGYLWATNMSQPTFTFSTATQAASFTASITGNQMTVTAVASGTIAVGQGVALTTANTVPSLTVILANVSGAAYASGGGTSVWTVSTTVGSPISSTSTFQSTTTQPTITVNTTSPHGFTPGQTINTYITSDNGTNNHLLAQGPYFVEAVTSATTFTYTCRAPGFITSGTAILGLVYARSDSNFSHRPFDGGVQLGTGLPSYAGQAIRMSKKYIRYQSGKSINFNTGLLMAPNYFVRQVTANGTAPGSTITITTDDVDHGCQIGAQVTLSGVITSGFNGTYTVSGIVDERTLQVIATQTLGTVPNGVTGATVTDPALLSINSWYGATVRSGTFDEQNGVFWQFDGQTPQVVRRSSTFQLAGTITVIVGSGQIIGLNTRFTTQCTVGCRVVIRGMTHMVTQVVNDTLMYVNPQYRGSTSVSGIKMTRTIDRAVPQNQWNIDRCDGTNSPYNPSGYLLVPTKMQMVCVQWTWYGAGFIDWMLRGPEGKYITVHRLRNNNLNNEAWMRAGNLPVRYEVLNEGPFSFISGTVAVGNTDTAIPINDASRFPTPAAGNTATIYIDNELISYTGVVSGYATATSASTNTVTVSSSANMAVNQPVVFTNNSTYANLGNIVSGVTYYVNSVLNSTTITLSTTSGGGVMTQINASIGSWLMTYGTLTGCTRAVSISPWATGGYRSFTAGSAASHAVSTGVILVNATASPIVSHWGAAFIEDGGFDTDRSYIFNYSQPNVNITTKKTTAFAVRLAPSVSNALTGDLGQRELINRASFLLQTLESSAGAGAGNAALVIEGIINPSNMPSLTNINFASLNSAANPTGQPSFSQVAPGSSMVFTGSVNNYLTSPVYIPAGTFYVPTTAAASSVSPAVLVGDDVFFPTSTGSLYGQTKVAQILAYAPALANATITVGSTATISTASISGTVLSGNVSAGTLAVGMVISGTGVVAGTYIVANLTGSATNGPSTWTVSISQSLPNPTSLTGTPYTLTVPTGVAGSPVLPGALLSGTGTVANTFVTSQLTNTTTQLGLAGTYALVSATNTITAQAATTLTATFNGFYLNQTTATGIAGSSNLSYTANFSRATYALPGETVFTYINAPANKDSLDLTSFKELTNTPIGGRGTYPNGCDILFINAYITQGTPINQNLVLRWGEAQA